MADHSNGNTEQGLRIFFSADIQSGTEFKYKRPPLPPDLRKSLPPDDDRFLPWTSVFIHFFRVFEGSFQEHIRSVFQNGYYSGAFRVKLWKTLGDEILFYQELESEEQAFWLTKAFYATIVEQDQAMSQQFGLGIKGTVWTAGFPIRNTRIGLNLGDSPKIRQDDFDAELFHASPALSDKDAAAPQTDAPVDQGLYTGSDELNWLKFDDFIGLEIDHGFRLTRFSSPGRVVISIDAAYIVSIGVQQTRTRLRSEAGVEKTNKLYSIKFHVVSHETLKGVYNGLPVPIIWARLNDVEYSAESRDQIDIHENKLAFQFVKGKETDEDKVMDEIKYVDFFRKYHSGLRMRGVDHIIPYVTPDLMHSSHKQNYE